MINVIKSKDRYHAERGWLDTYWHFSFDEYYDPANTNWGALRVFNEDVIQPGQGFGAHPHRDMEIITYVLEGELEHKDNQGNTGVIHAGEVQVMSAGTGVFHSEYNHSKAKPVHLLQIWVMPRARGLKPRWEQRAFTRGERSGKLLPVVSSGDRPETLKIDQDAAIFVSSLASGQEVAHMTSPGRKPYLFAIAGSLSVNGVSIAAGDQARIADEAKVTLRAEKNSELILLDLPS